MSKGKHIFVTLVLLEFVLSFSQQRSNPFYLLGWPLAAILFGLFLTAQMLEREPALLEQNRAAIMDQHEPVWQPQSLKNSQYEVATHPVPAIARHH